VRLPAVVLVAFFLLGVGAMPACTANQLVGELALVTDGGDTGDDGGVDGDDDGGVEDEDAGPQDGGPRDGGTHDGGGDNLQAFPQRPQ